MFANWIIFFKKKNFQSLFLNLRPFADHRSYKILVLFFKNHSKFHSYLIKYWISTMNMNVYSQRFWGRKINKGNLCYALIPYISFVKLSRFRSVPLTIELNIFTRMSYGNRSTGKTPTYLRIQPSTDLFLPIRKAESWNPSWCLSMISLNHIAANRTFKLFKQKISFNRANKKLAAA